MSRFTRREFIKNSLLSIGALTVTQVIQGCGLDDQHSEEIQSIRNADGLESPENPNDNPLAKKEITNLPFNPQESPQVDAYPYIVSAHNGEPEFMVRQAVNALGGIQRFVSPGDHVVIKPNICVAYHTYEYAATTNPWVVRALVQLCMEAGAKKVQVMDHPFGGKPENAYAISGIQNEVLAAGGEMVIMPAFRFSKTSIPKGIDLKETDVFDDVMNSDVFINVPIAKHHGLATLTLGMKNLMGVIKNRPALHQNLGQNLADLTSLIRPDLTIIDAIRVLMANGPTGGNLDDVKKMDTIIASTDIVAADSYAASYIGIRPDDLTYIRAGASMGLGRSDLNNLTIEEINLAA